MPTKPTLLQSLITLLILTTPIFSIDAISEPTNNKDNKKESANKVEVQPDTTTSEIELDNSFTTLVIQVKGKDDQFGYISEADIYLKLLEDNSEYNATTDNQGKATLENVPLGKVKVVITSSEHETYSKITELKSELNLMDIELLKTPLP